MGNAESQPSPIEKRDSLTSAIVQSARNTCRVSYYLVRVLSIQYNIIYDVWSRVRRYHSADAGGAHPRVMECSVYSF